MNINMTPGEYWVAALINSANTYTGAGITIIGGGGLSNGGSNYNLRPIGAVAGINAFKMQGIYTAATTALPSSILVGDINYTSDSNMARANFYNSICALS
jgi:hypothetical protein